MPRPLPSSARAHAVAVDEPALRMSHALLGAALLALLATAGQARAERLAEATAPLAHASFLAMSADSPEHQRARLSTALQFAAAPEASGASATFGWLEATGEVRLMSHGSYPSAAQLARSEREVESATPIRALGELPRYLMICSWTVAGGEAQAPTLAYAERDDANGRQSSTRTYASLSVPWVPTSAWPAQLAFAGHDWCGEIARSGQSSAALWPADGRPAAYPAPGG